MTSYVVTYEFAYDGPCMPRRSTVIEASSEDDARREMERRQPSARLIRAEAAGPQQRERGCYNGVDNYGRPKSDYIAKIAAMLDEELGRECYQMIYHSARCNNNRRADWHWMVDACYDEARRRDESAKIYVEAYTFLASAAGEQTMAIKFRNAISIWEEMLAYETIWGLKRGSLKDVSELFQRHQSTPSKVLSVLRTQSLVDLDEIRSDVERFVAELCGFSVCVHGAFQYPDRLRSARYPLELFYYRGDIGLTESRCVSVVGTRSATDDGIRRAKKLARGLAEKGYTVISGLAAGIDAAGMAAAIEAGGKTIGVIGTPINQSYPRENEELQKRVSDEHLLVSQVPFWWYSKEPFPLKKRYFPERNATMSALSEATIIVEASEKSGTLTQARACLQQGRKLFILNSCFDNPHLTWPTRYEKLGATRVKDFDDIFSSLGDGSDGK